MSSTHANVFAAQPSNYGTHFPAVMLFPCSSTSQRDLNKLLIARPTTTLKRAIVNISTGDVSDFPTDKSIATSSGGYSASPDVWSNKSQRGGQDPYRHHKTNSTGAIQQSLNGTDLTSGLDDAKQGNDSIMTEADV